VAVQAPYSRDQGSLARLGVEGVVVRDPPLAVPEHSLALMWSERLDADAGSRWLRARIRAVAPGVMRPRSVE